MLYEPHCFALKAQGLHTAYAYIMYTYITLRYYITVTIIYQYINTIL